MSATPGAGPASLAAETAVLGAILLDNRHYVQAAGCIEAADFSLDSHRRIFRCMGELLARGNAADMVTLSEELERRGEVAAVGGLAYLASLTEGLPRRISIDDYVRLVKDKSLLRQTARESERLRDRACREEAPSDLLAEAEAAFRRIAERQDDGGLESLGEYVRRSYPRVDAILERNARLSGIASGFEKLDRLTAGFQPQELTILGARPSIGKTAIAANMAAAAAAAGKRVAFFSLEMPREALLDRLCCARAGIDLQQRRHGRLSEAQKRHFLEALAEVMEAPLLIDDRPGQSAMAIEAKAAREKSRRGLDLVVIDYLQLMSGERRGYENREQVVSGISRAVKAMAKRLNLPVILLSQLNRELHKRPDKRPILSDLRESGSIEQDADLVLFLHREEYYNRDDPALAGRAELLIAKSRNGPLGAVELTYDAAACRFESAGPWAG